MRPEDIIDKLRSMPHFSRLKFAYLYGSAASGKKTARSDVDICLYYDVKDKKLLHRLLFRISGSVPDEYDIQLFNMLPLYVRHEVFRGKLLYAKDKGFVHDIARKTLLDFEDFEPRYKYILHGKAGMKVAL